MNASELKKRIKILKSDFTDDYQDSDGQWDVVVNWEKLARYINSIWKMTDAEKKLLKKGAK